MAGLLRHPASRIKLLLLGVLVLGTYLLLVEGPQDQKAEAPSFDADVIENELMEKKVRIDVEFKSPYTDEFFSGKPKGKAARRGGNVWRGAKTHKTKEEREGEPSNEDERIQKYNRIWTLADKAMGRAALYPEGQEAMVTELRHALATARIVHVDALTLDPGYESGTSEKWVLTLEGGQKAMMKIIWGGKGKMKKNGECNLGYEMAWSEMAAFHLHWVLGFRNTPAVSGRRVDLLKEILPVATPAVRNQIQVLAEGGACVTGKCYFCKTPDRLCPPGGVVEASIALWVQRNIKLYTFPPGYMPYSTPRMDEWGKIGFNNKTYCNKVQLELKPYNSPWYYHDLFDFAVLDTLMFHYDSKHYVIYDGSPARGLTVRLDHGRAFCDSSVDDVHVFLAPVSQCCTLRASTYEKLMRFKSGGLLSKEWRAAMEDDPLAPLMDDVWFPVIERRLQAILKTIDKCAVANGGMQKVLVH